MCHTNHCGKIGGLALMTSYSSEANISAVVTAGHGEQSLQKLLALHARLLSSTLIWRTDVV
jgi:hypothetical protein